MDSQGSRRRLTGPLGPLAFWALAASPDKGPRVRGCPQGGRAGLLPPRPHGRASLPPVPKPAPPRPPHKWLWLHETSRTNPTPRSQSGSGLGPRGGPHRPCYCLGAQVSSSFPLDSVSLPTPRSASWAWVRGVLIWPQGEGPLPPTAGQRATESQKQLLSPEHSSCAWISFPALLPEQRPGPDGVFEPLSPRLTSLDRSGLRPSLRCAFMLELTGVDVWEPGRWPSPDPGVVLVREGGPKSSIWGCNGGGSPRAAPARS